MKMKIEDGVVKFSIQDFIEALSSDEKLAVAKCIATSDWFLEKAINYLCDEDEDEWWTGDSSQKRHSILRRIEDKQLDKLPSYYWRAWDEVQDALKRITSREELYWKIYHETIQNQEHQAWLRKVEPHYTIKTAEKEIEEVKEIIRNALSKMKEGALCD